MEKPKLLLIQPNYRLVYSYAGSNTATPIYPPLGLAYIAAIVKEAGYPVKILEANAYNLTHDEIKKEILNYNPDCVALSASSSLMNEVDKICNLCPKNVKIILGGIHASSVPDEVLTNHSRIDLVVRKEGEETIVKILSGEKYENIDGISYRDINGNNIHNKDSKFIDDLDKLPFPARDLLPMNKYFSFEARRSPIDYIVSGRGCPYRCTFCFHPDTNIMTNKGILKIKDMHNNTQVLTHKGRLKEKRVFFKRPYNGELLNIKTKYFLDELKITPNHKVYALKNNETDRGKEPYLIEANQLKEKDYLVIPITKEEQDIEYLELDKILPSSIGFHKSGKKLSKEIIEKIFLLKNNSTRRIAKLLNISKSATAYYLKYSDKGDSPIVLKKSEDYIFYSHGKNKIPVKIKLTAELCRLFGYYLAEGHVSFSKNRPNSGTLIFTFNANEENYINDTCELIRKYFELEPIITKIKESNTKQILVINTVIAHLFRALFNSGSENKKIPTKFLYIPKDKIKQLLKGYFLGDGNQNYRNLRITSVSKELIQQIKFLSLRLEIIPSEYKRDKEKIISKINNRAIIAKHDSYELVFRGENAKELYELFDKDYPYKNIRSWKEAKITKDYILLPIKSITKKHYDGFVYNMSVEDDTSYTANNIAVSNCADFITSGRKLRIRSAESIIKEIQFLVDTYGTQEIDFQDDNFTFYPDRIFKFCNLMIKTGLNKKIVWKVANGVRCDKLSLPMLKHMKKAGCYMLSLGIESGNQEILDKMRKAEKLEDIKNATKWCHKAGIETRGLFIFGNIGENRKTMEDTINFAKSLPLDTATFHICIPMPGTEHHELIKKEGKFLNVGWEGLTAYSDGAFVLENVNPKLMTEMQKKAYRKFYIRPSFIIKRFFRIRSFNDVKLIAKGGLEVLKFASN